MNDQSYQVMNHIGRLRARCTRSSILIDMVQQFADVVLKHADNLIIVPRSRSATVGDVSSMQATYIGIVEEGLRIRLPGPARIRMVVSWYIAYDNARGRIPLPDKVIDTPVDW